MKKFITLFSLIALFFIGIQQTQAQEGKSLGDVETDKKEKVEHYNELANKEKKQSPEHKAKVAQLELEEANVESKQMLAEFSEWAELSKDQENALYKVFTESNKSLIAIGSDDKSKEAVEARVAINEETSLMIKEILNEEQMVKYNMYLEKRAK